MRYLHFLIGIPLLLTVIVFVLTRNQPREYSSKTTVYTGIASGYSIENQGDSRIDFFAVNNAFDNLINIIKSRNTIEKVGLMLLSQHLMLKKANPNLISAEHYNELMSTVPKEVLKLVDYTSFDNTFNNLSEYLHTSNNTYIIRLINLTDPHYSVKVISDVKVKRIQNSDLIELAYSSNDPGICQQTLVFLTNIFIENYTGLKVRQTDAVIHYFEDQLKNSESNLKKVENDLLTFNTENNILNYYEQTKFIASQKEDLDLEYQRTLMTLRGAEAVIKNLEQKMDSQTQLFLKSDEIIDRRNKLGAINGKIALYKIDQKQDSLNINSTSLMLLEQQANIIKNSLKDAIDSLYLYSSNKSGLSTKTIFENWLRNVIIFDETQASLAVLDDRVKEFKQKYATFAPLGANLKRIERVINVNEQEYLSFLHSLALAKLKQQNLELSSNLKVLDAPFLPIEPLPSKRKFILIISFMGGFVFILFLILAIEYLDQNIKNHSKANDKIGCEVVGMYPLMVPASKMDMKMISDRASDLLLKKVLLNRSVSGQKNGPHIIMVFSTREREGKSLIIKELTSGLSTYGFKSLFLNYNIQEKSDSPNYDYQTYDSRERCFAVADFNDLVYFGEREDWNNYDFVFWEIPSITKNFYPFNLVSKVNSSFLICRANRVWSVSDANALNTLREIKNIQPQIIVNGVDAYEMESIVGDLPRNRRFIRVLLKRILKFQFLSKKSL